MDPYGPFHMPEQKQGDHLEPTYSSSVRIQGVARRTRRKRWTIGRGGEKGSVISVLMAWLELWWWSTTGTYFGSFWQRNNVSYSRVFYFCDTLLKTYFTVLSNSWKANWFVSLIEFQNRSAVLYLGLSN